MRIGSLFSGIGGLELGLERAGLGYVSWQVEIDPTCRLVLARHWPDTQRFDDIRSVSRDNLAPIDIICGGFPCQDLSLAGRGAGLTGARSGLWFEYLRLIGQLRPRIVIVENVAALVTRGLDVVTGGLSACGYDALWLTLRASDVGAPHQRARLFLVAWRRDVGPERIPDTHGEPLRELAERGKFGSRPANERDAVARHLGAYDVAHGDGEGQSQSGGLVPDLKRRACDGGDELADATSLRRQRVREVAGGTGSSQEERGLRKPAGARAGLADTDGTRLEVGPGERRDARPERATAERSGDAVGHPASIGRGQGRTEREGWERQPAPVSASGSAHDWPPGPHDTDGLADYLARHPCRAPAVLTGRGAMTLNPAFVEALMGFPEDWTDGHKRGQRLKMLGNAVVPQCAEVVGLVAAGVVGLEVLS